MFTYTTQSGASGALYVGAPRCPAPLRWRQLALALLALACGPPRHWDVNTARGFDYHAFPITGGFQAGSIITLQNDVFSRHVLSRDALVDLLPRDGALDLDSLPLEGMMSIDTRTVVEGLLNTSGGGKTARVDGSVIKASRLSMRSGYRVLLKQGDSPARAALLSLHPQDLGAFQDGQPGTAPVLLTEVLVANGGEIAIEFRSSVDAATSLASLGNYAHSFSMKGDRVLVAQFTDQRIVGYRFVPVSMSTSLPLVSCGTMQSRARAFARSDRPDLPALRDKRYTDTSTVVLGTRRRVGHAFEEYMSNGAVAAAVVAFAECQRSLASTRDTATVSITYEADSDCLCGSPPAQGRGFTGPRWTVPIYLPRVGRRESWELVLASTVLREDGDVDTSLPKRRWTVTPTCSARTAAVNAVTLAKQDTITFALGRGGATTFLLECEVPDFEHLPGCWSPEAGEGARWVFKERVLATLTVRRVRR